MGMDGKKISSVFKSNHPYDVDILKEIKSGIYNKEKVKNQRGRECTVNKCNLFVDSVAKRYGVSLPRHPEAEPNSMYEGWEDRPLRVKKMEPYLKGRTIYENSGVTQVDREMAADLANDGQLVIYTHSGAHSTVMAPTRGSRPQVYRSDLANRKGDTRRKVGVGKKANFFYINPEKYNAFDAAGAQGNSPAEIIRYGEGVGDYQKIGEDDPIMSRTRFIRNDDGDLMDTEDTFGRDNYRRE